ncbi:dTMP kinase [Erythrobacter crassostreae]|uniref:Thymidylate kinase n=1 Tax=Erythrobacter crassostreae TaxID=2828328 RepID=A0A9X1JLD2_9SPHN|nr:dTMP kinase [Erythrobacter crassostrea]MBV7260020.1 dTMP kinase [Erythrobacter crassostrea]
MTDVQVRGRFVAFEGGEGAGKTTQAELLAAALRARAIEVDVTREPGGTPGAEAIRTLLLDPPGDGWSLKAEALLFAAARADHVEHRILPALEAGKWVICDRFVDSSRAYQGGAGGLGDEAILGLHQFGSDGLRPDLTVLLDVDPDKLGQRLIERDGGKADAIGGRSSDYHQKVASRFSVLAQANPKSFAVVDGSGAADQVHDAVMQAIVSLLSGGAG